MSKVDVVEILKKSDALLEGHFLLSSGKHSNRYVQCAKVLRFPKYAEQVLSTVVDQIKDLDIDMGDVEISNTRDIGYIINEENGYLTTGKSTIETKEALEKLGGEVIGVACIANRTSKDIGMPIYSAIKLDIQVHDADECPLCKEGKIELVKPGSREFKELGM